jgi:hypothetical protein
MSRAQPKSSPTDDHARRIARAIAKGRPPPFSAELDRYCDAGRQKFFSEHLFQGGRSSIDSANSFFSLRFSSSSAFSRRASETSMPPYFDRHL